MDNNIQSYSNPCNNKYKDIFNRFILRKTDSKNVANYPVINKDNKNTPENKHNSGRRTLYTGAAVIAAGGGILMFSKGFQKNAGKYLNKLKSYLEYRLELSSIHDSGKAAKFYDYSIRKLNSFIKKSESINNITSLKDILFMKLMYKTKTTRKIHQTISNIFENLSQQTVIKSYKKTSEKFEKMYKIFDKLDDYIIKKSGDEIVEYAGERHTKRDWVEKAKEHRAVAQMIVPVFSTKEAMQMRYERIDKITSSLYSRFWEVSFKDFWTKQNKFKRKEMWQTFIAAKQIKADKTDLANDIALVRDALTYTDKDKHVRIFNHIKNLDEIIPSNDTEGIDIINQLKWFIKNPEIYAKNKDLFLKELEKLKKHKLPEFSDLEITKAQTEVKESQIKLIEALVKENATGEIQDMLSIYYRIAPYELSKSGAELALKQAVSSFDKSVNLEISEFFDKLRDLRLGSAPTDILTILISCGFISYGLGYAQNGEERASIVLKSGIPIVGAILTSLISATKLVSGGKSLALGAVSGLVLNQLGTVADKMRKTYFNKK